MSCNGKVRPDDGNLLFYGVVSGKRISEMRRATIVSTGPLALLNAIEVRSGMCLRFQSAMLIFVF